MMRYLIFVLLSLSTALMSVAAQNEEIVDVGYIMQEWDGGTILRRLTSGGAAYSDSTFLPPEFGLIEYGSNSSGSVRWGVDWALEHVAVSPDANYIAFSAYDLNLVTGPENTRSTEYRFGFFIYHLTDHVLTAIDINHMVDVHWSPGSDAIILNAVEFGEYPLYEGPDTLLYDLKTAALTPLKAGDGPPPPFVDGYDTEFSPSGIYYGAASPPFVWLSDEEVAFQAYTLDCTSECQPQHEVYVTNRNGSDPRALTHLSDQVEAGITPFIHDLIWSAENERLYVQLGGNNNQDIPAVYSVDVTGNVRHEMTMDERILGYPPGETTYVSIKHVAPTAAGVFVIASSSNSQGSSWFIVRLGEDTDQMKTIYEYSGSYNTQEYPEFSPAAGGFSPTGRLAAVNLFRQIPGSARDGNVTQTIDLETGKVIATLETGTACQIRWIDEHQYTYITVEPSIVYPCQQPNKGLWLFDVNNPGQARELTDYYGTSFTILLPGA